MPVEDVIIVGGGHNGLVAATLLARAGRRVLVLERADVVGGAAVSASPFPGVDARISRYSYLVSLFPRELLTELGLGVRLHRRRISSYTPWGDTGVLVSNDVTRTRDSIVRTTGRGGDFEALQRFGELTTGLASRVFGTLTEPLRSAEQFRELVGEPAWEALFRKPLGELLTDLFEGDVVRGIVATDALIGTFADMDDEALRQNRCFLYHVIGNGTGHWDVPEGGMGALTGGLAELALSAGARMRLRSRVESIDADGDRKAPVRVITEDGESLACRHLLAGVAPSLLAELLGGQPVDPAPEGSQLKINLLLSRLPRLRDESVSVEEAFAGTFHVNESYAQLQTSYAEAAAGRIPSLPPCEAYCHSLTDPSILGSSLRQAGAQTLTVFGLHMPARLFREDPEAAKREAVEATLRSIDSVLAEPLRDRVLRAPGGELCLEARTPVELEAELGLPGGHIFHRDLAWPFAESKDEVGRWGVETERPNVWLCGAGARRGGGVSGIPGHNAARALLEAD